MKLIYIHQVVDRYKSTLTDSVMKFKKLKALTDGTKSHHFRHSLISNETRPTCCLETMILWQLLSPYVHQNIYMWTYKYEEYITITNNISLMMKQ